LLAGVGSEDDSKNLYLLFMGLKAHAPSAKTGRNKGDTCFIEQMAEFWLRLPGQRRP
jgi:hypothetical protein